MDQDSKGDKGNRKRAQVKDTHSLTPLGQQSRAKFWALVSTNSFQMSCSDNDVCS